MRVIALAAVLFLVAVSASWASAGGVSGSAALKKPSALAKTRWRASVATLPGKSQSTYIGSISCASPGNCTAVGSYGNYAAGLLLTEKAGHWAAGVEAVLPANADSDPEVSLNSVSCASAGNCTAVGTYNNSSLGQSGLLLTETAGYWVAGVEAALPASDAFPELDVVSLNSVSCPSAGNCTAVGSYHWGGGGLLLTEKAGQWARGVEAPLPSNAEAGQGAELSSVSCPSDGSCSAVGYYNVAVGRDVDAGEGLLLTKRRGAWRAVKAVMPPDGPGEAVVLTSVSCASAGNCGAIGLYNINVDADYSDEGVLLTEAAGKWRRGVKAMGPKSASVGLSGISCASKWDCVAMGGYYTLNAGHLTLLTEEAGTWRTGVEAALPRHAPYPDGFAVSCASPGNCTAVGDYRNHSGTHGLLLTEIAGSWARGVTTPHSTDYVSSVSCASPGNCSAVGGDSRGHGILLDSSTKPCVVPKVKGRTLPTARHRIESRNCSVGTIEHARSVTVAAGHVISQTPRPGRHLPPGTKVDLAVSSGR